MSEPSPRKRIWRTLAWLLAGIVALAALTLVVVYVVSTSRLRRHYEVSVQPAPIPTDSTAIERGRHIATTRGCLDCHGKDLGGATVVDDPMLGKVHGPNLTRGTGGLPAGHRNEDWVRAIRHGIGFDGRPLVIMPSIEYAGLSDDDLGSLLAFLQSVPNTDRPSVPVSLGPIGRILLVTGQMPLAADVIEHAAVRPDNVAPGVTVEYGRYLIANCVGCHGPNLSGGKITGGPPDWPPASNLTTVADGPVARWSEADFIATLRSHRRPDGTELHEAMPRNFGQFTDLELRALWTYLRTVPPAATGKRD